MSASVSISPLGRILRKPYYWFWRVLNRTLYTGREYTLHVPYGQRIYTPWFNADANDEFSQVMRVIESSGPTIVARDRCALLAYAVRQALYLEGDLAECGVYTGGTAQLAAELMQRAGVKQRTLHLFDTFTGMPDTVVPQRDYHRPGDFGGIGLAPVQARLTRYGSLVTFHPGLIPTTLGELAPDARFSFVHIDVDVYDAVRDSLIYFWQRMAPGGIVVLDDYGFWPYRHAARRAADEFFATTLEKPWALPTGQAMAIKLPERAVEHAAER